MEKDELTRLDKIKEGDFINKIKIKKKYFFDNDKKFIIFKDENDNVNFYSSKQITSISTLMGQCNLMKDLSHGKKIKEWIDAQKASALNEFFLGNEDKSKEVLNVCIETIKNNEKTRKKLIYIGVYLCSIILLVILMFIAQLKFSEWQYIKFLRIIVFGAFGGFVSLNTRMKKIEFNLYETTLSYVLVSLYKIVFACVSSIIVCFLIEADLILSALKSAPGVTYIAATLAGFSESLIPNIFSGMEKEVSIKQSE